MRRLALLLTAVTVLLVIGLSTTSKIDPLFVRGEWIRTAQSPLSARDNASIAWNGAEIIVFGGILFACPPLASCITPPSSSILADGAAYDPTTDTWRKIADAPPNIIWGEVVTAGTDIFALAIVNYDYFSVRLLRYQSAPDIWDQIQLPERIVSPGIVAFGSDILVFTSSDEREPTADWLFNTVTGDWTRLPDDPLGPGFGRRFVAHGDDLYLFDHALVPSPGGASGPSYLRAARLRTQQWQLLPTADSIGFAPTLIAGDRLITLELGCADGGQTNNYGRCIPFGAVFDTSTDTWHELPDAPDQGPNYASIAAGLYGNVLVLTKPGTPALDAETNTWFIVPQLDNDLFTQRTVRAAGPYGFAFGGARFTEAINAQLLDEAWIWRP